MGTSSPGSSPLSVGPVVAAQELPHAVLVDEARSAASTVPSTTATTTAATTATATTTISTLPPEVLPDAASASMVLFPSAGAVDSATVMPPPLRPAIAHLRHASLPGGALLPRSPPPGAVTGVMVAGVAAAGSSEGIAAARAAVAAHQLLPADRRRATSAATVAVRKAAVAFAVANEAVSSATAVEEADASRESPPPRSSREDVVSLVWGSCIPRDTHAFKEVHRRRASFCHSVQRREA